MTANRPAHVRRASPAACDHPITAEAAGIDVARYTALTFAVGAACAGVAGALAALLPDFIAPESFTYWLSILLLMGSVFGGMTSVWAHSWADSSLRKRAGDVKLLAHAFVKKYGAGRITAGIDESAMGALEAHAWPGNVRELQNIIERACALTDGPTISRQDLPEHILVPAMSRSEASPALASHVTGDVLTSSTELPLEDAREHWLQILEASYLRDALTRHGGNISAAAQSAGIDRKTFHRLLTNTASADPTDAVVAVRAQWLAASRGHRRSAAGTSYCGEGVPPAQPWQLSNVALSLAIPLAPPLHSRCETAAVRGDDP
jgi:hypothetical protein